MVHRTEIIKYCTNALDIRFSDQIAPFSCLDGAPSPAGGGGADPTPPPVVQFALRTATGCTNYQPMNWLAEPAHDP